MAGVNVTSFPKHLPGGHRWNQANRIDYSRLQELYWRCWSGNNLIVSRRLCIRRTYPKSTAIKQKYS